MSVMIHLRRSPTVYAHDQIRATATMASDYSAAPRSAAASRCWGGRPLTRCRAARGGGVRRSVGRWCWPRGAAAGLGRCCMNTLWGWGRASWAGCGPDVRRGGQTLIMGYSADKSPLIGHLAGPLRRLEPLVAQRQEKCGPNRPTPTGYSCNNAPYQLARPRRRRCRT